MTDFTWPDDLVPYAQSFWLQPHTGGSESPFSRQTKVYELTAPRWMCTMSFRGGVNGTRDQAAFGPRLDALIAALRGRANRIAIYDFRRPQPRGRAWPSTAGNVSAAAGDTSLTITGLRPGAPVYAGDYFGGDGRPHLITHPDFAEIAAVADGSGHATVTFFPPLSTGIGTDAAIFAAPTALFMLTDDDAGQNGVEVGDLVRPTLNFVEAL